MTKKLNKKQHEAIRKLVLVLAILAILAFVIFKIKIVLTANVIKEQIESEEKKKIQEEYKDWLIENCECTERLKFLCPEGFELKGKLCITEGKYTYRLKSCSQYDCSGEIHELNLDSLEWGVK